MMTFVTRGGRRVWMRRSLALGAGVLLLASCGETSFNYVKNSADETYLKVPRSWEVLDAELENDPGAQMPAPWQRVFDAAEPASIEHAKSYDTDHVTGRLTVIYVGPAEADKLSVEDVRAAVSPLESDPLALAEQPNQGQGRVLDFKVESRDGGLRGSRVVYEVGVDSGANVVLDQTTLLDPKPYANPRTGGSMFKVYVLSLHCKTTCYEKSKSEIDDVVTSWTVIR
jgi:hypothetical protein